MKKTKYIIVFIVLIGLSSCIGEDIIEDRIDASLKINNPLVSIAVGDTYQYTAVYLNNVGQEENVTLQWSSSDPNIIDIDASSGLANAIQEGQATISVSTPDDPEVSSINNNLQITRETIVDNQISKSGTIVTTSSYILKGDFILEDIEEDNIIRLSIKDNYEADTLLPGLYIYLTNNPNTINNAFEIGPVSVFSGAHTYEISKDDVQLNQYSHILYWCKPFTTKVGEGEIK